MMKSFSYYVVRPVYSDDMQLRKVAQKAVSAAGLVTRKTFPMTARGKAQADSYAAKMDAALSGTGLKATVNDGFSMTAPE